METERAGHGDTAVIRFGLRVLLKSPAFAAMAILTMALGVGVSTAVFSIARAVLLQPLPFADADRLMVMTGTEARSQYPIQPVSWPRFEFIREHSRSYAGLAAFAGEDFTYSGGGQAERAICARVSPNFFDLLGVHPAMGPGFAGGAFEVIVSHEFWRRSLNADPSVIGRAIELNGGAYTVTGILPPVFQFLPLGRVVDVYIPRPFEQSVLKQSQIDAGAGYLFALGRLNPGVSPQQAKQEMAALDADYRRAKPGLVDAGPTFAVVTSALREYTIADIKPAVMVLIGAVGFVLLISCANVAGLMVARAMERRREISIRMALGARGALIVRQLLFESLLPAGAGCVAGIALGYAATKAMVALTGPTFAMVAGVHLDGAAVAFAAGVSLFCGVLFGLAPALQLSKPEIEGALRAESGRGTGTRERHSVRNALIVAQVALSIVLLAGSTLLIRSFDRLRHSGVGVDPDHVLAVSLTLTAARYSGADRQNAFVREALARVAAIPGVASAAVSSALPVNPARSSPMQIEGQPVAPLRSRPILFFQMVTPDYAKTLHVPVIEGRMFDERDNESGGPVAMVNRAFARRYWPDRDPVGASVLLGLSTKPTPVIGVLGDVKNEKLTLAAAPEVYVPWAQRPWLYVNLTVRTSGPAAAIAPAVRRALASVDPGQPLREVQTLDELLDNASREERMLMVLVSAFSVCAFAMAVVGLYGVISYSVAQRTREMGVRVALGAASGDIAGMVVRQAGTLAGIGIAVGIMAALGLTRLMESKLYGISPADPVSFGVAAVVFGVVAVAASLVPALRAARLNPVEALRAE